MSAVPDLLSPSASLLLELLRPSPLSREDLCAHSHRSGFCWDETRALAVRNRVAGVAAAALECSDGGLDPAERSAWRRLRMLAVFRREAASRQLCALGGILDAAGVATLVYKGLDFHGRLYDDDAPREFNDLDLVVPTRAVDTAVAALEAGGYQHHVGAWGRRLERRLHLHTLLTHPSHRAPLELHWALDAGHLTSHDPVPELLSRAELAPALGAALRRPAEPDALALMVLHLEKHVGLCAALPTPAARLAALCEARGLVWVLDVARWMRTCARRHPADALLPRLRVFGAERSLVVALRLARDLDPEALPAWAHEAGGRLPAGRPVLTRVVYPDLARGRPSSAAAASRRRRLDSALPALGFRPLRPIAALLPRFRVPGIVGAQPAAPGLGWRRAAMVLSAVLGLLYSLFMPVWEAPNEQDHYRMALLVARENRLPESPENVEANQPPLYYWIASVPLRLLDRVDPAWVEFHAPPIQARQLGPIYTWRADNHRTHWGALVLRWLNVLLVVATVGLVHRGALALAPATPPLAAAAACLTATTPQLLHVGASVSNAALAALGGAFLFARLGGIANGTHTRGQLVSSVGAALAVPFLTKLTVVPMSAALLIVTLAAQGSCSDTRARARLGAAVTVVGVLAGAALLSLEPLQTLAREALARATYVRPSTSTHWSVSLEFFVQSFWGRVGYVQEGLPAGVAWALTAGVVGGLGASLRWLFPTRKSSSLGARPLSLLPLVAVVLALSWLDRWSATVAGAAIVVVTARVLTQSAPEPETRRLGWVALWFALAFAAGAILKNALATRWLPSGRYLFPELGALSTLAAAGWVVLLGSRSGTWLPTLVLAVMLPVNALLLHRIERFYFQPWLD